MACLGTPLLCNLSLKESQDDVFTIVGVEVVATIVTIAGYYRTRSASFAFAVDL
jgi:hypothetical protein